jgi:hypothetical protein
LEWSRPTIIGVGPTEGDAAKILNKTNTGRMFNDSESLSIHIEKCITGDLSLKERNNKEISKYARGSLVKKLVRLLQF